jgi:Cu+-exporting ATPase
MVGTGVGAKNGILIKGGGPLEASRHLRKVVLDKTGTVTAGKFSVADLSWVSLDPGIDRSNLYQTPAKSPNPTVPSQLFSISADGITSRAAVLAMVVAAEARSEHPLARAVAAYGRDALKTLGLSAPTSEVLEFESEPGAGVRATVTLTVPSDIASRSTSSYEIFIGTAAFVAQARTSAKEGEFGLSLPEGLRHFEDQESQLGRTVIFASIAASSSTSSSGKSHFSSPRIALALSLADQAKLSAKYAVQALQSMGIEVYLLTGDSESTAQAIAKELNISSQAVWSRVSPKGKTKVIQDLIDRHEGGVAMVSDLHI